MTLTKEKKPDFSALALRATITIHAEQDDCPVRGNAMASGDDDDDRACEDVILARLDKGDLWAWASVTVRAELDEFTGENHLGGCSYLHEEDFRQQGGYFEQMQEEARTDLACALERAWETLTR